MGNGIFFDVGIFNISLGAGNTVIKIIDNLIAYYNEMIDWSANASDEFGLAIGSFNAFMTE